MNIISGLVISIIGIILIYLNSLSKQKTDIICNRCGNTMLGRKCPKCGYENYEKEDFQSNSFMGKFGIILLIIGIIWIPISLRIFNSDNINNVFNALGIEVENNTIIFAPDNEEDNVVTPTIPEDNTTVDNNVTVNDNTTNNNSKTNSDTNVAKYSITTSGEGFKNGKCVMNSFNASISGVNSKMVKLSYTVNITETSKEQPDNKLAFRSCQYVIYLYDLNDKLVFKINDFSMVNYGQTKSYSSFRFIDTKETNFKAVIKAK